ncbi:MAG TPA: hypothetical protein VLN59_14540 [Burkholderiales bacterium]|nr:hypothetical protein [Burkholderiales bacterium]
MRALNLDFRRRERQSKWLGFICVICGLAGAIAMGVQYQRIADDMARVEASIRTPRTVRKAPDAPVRSDADVPRVALEIKHASDVLHQLNVPWDDLLASVEAANIEEVALLSIDSDVERRTVNISGEAKNLPAMLNYTRSLQARPILADIYLQSHEIQAQDPQHPVRFVLSANWQVRK